MLELLQAGYDVVIADNLCNSNLECLRRVQQLAGRDAIFHEVDIRDKEALSAVFAQYDVDAVIHFAGLKAVGESVAEPLRYYQNNVEGTLNLIEVMRDAGCRNIVFSSSATVYGDPAYVTHASGLHVRACISSFSSRHTTTTNTRVLASPPLRQWHVRLVMSFSPTHACGTVRVAGPCQ